MTNRCGWNCGQEWNWWKCEWRWGVGHVEPGVGGTVVRSVVHGSVEHGYQVWVEHRSGVSWIEVWSEMIGRTLKVWNAADFQVCDLLDFFCGWNFCGFHGYMIRRRDVGQYFEHEDFKTQIVIQLTLFITFATSQECSEIVSFIGDTTNGTHLFISAMTNTMSPFSKSEIETTEVGWVEHIQ